MDAKAVSRASQQALSSRDGYYVEFERLTGLTPTQVSTYLRTYESLSEEDLASLQQRNGISTVHAYLSERIREGAAA